ncbi:MAG: hypothetical protein V7L20_14850 [Nostoc sp.]|uniref:hypothetical protein n=1 Tax=Nostoc sp. TaxID=1180 RepID=UPI002FF579E6
MRIATLRANFYKNNISWFIESDGKLNSQELGGRGCSPRRLDHRRSGGTIFPMPHAQKLHATCGMEFFISFTIG